jgi:hypothetical protein
MGGTADEKPGQLLSFVGGLLSGSATGLATQVAIACFLACTLACSPMLRPLDIVPFKLCVHATVQVLRNASFTGGRMNTTQQQHQYNTATL